MVIPAVVVRPHFVKQAFAHASRNRGNIMTAGVMALAAAYVGYLAWKVPTLTLPCASTTSNVHLAIYIPIVGYRVWIKGWLGFVWL